MELVSIFHIYIIIIFIFPLLCPLSALLCLWNFNRKNMDNQKVLSKIKCKRSGYSSLVCEVNAAPKK